MYLVECDLIGNKPIVFGRFVDQDEIPEEKGMDKWDKMKKHFYLKANTDENGDIIIPSFAIRNCLVTAATKAGDKFKGTTKWGSLFRTGFECPEDCYVKVSGKNIKAKKADGWSAFLPSSPGAAGAAGNKRVLKKFPIVRKGWSIHIKLIIEDDRISSERVEEYLTLAGQRVGLGSFRKENNGIWGTFAVKNFKSKGK